MSLFYLFLNIVGIASAILFLVSFASYFEIFDLFDFISSRRRYLKHRKEVESYEENKKNP